MGSRVAITGLGAVTPLGLDVPTTWQALLAGQSGIGPITRFDASGMRCQIAGELKGFDPEAAIGRKEARRTDRFVQMAIVAANEALADAGLTIDDGNRTEIGVMVGSGIGGIETLVEQINVLQTRGPDRVSPFLVPMFIVDLVAGEIAIRVGAQGPNYSIVSACSTSAHCIGEAAEVIRRGDAVAMLAGGSEAGVVPIGVAGFAAMRALSERNDAPARASRPFDAERDGFVMGEGAGVVVLEDLEYARARGARVYAEVLGYGATDDAYHITAPSEGGEGAVRAMRLALKKARLEPADVGYVNAHGTSTPLNDKLETQALKTVFGRAAYDVPVSSTKSMTGHLLGAAGVVETIVCVLAIRDGRLPPTINYEHPDPECDLDYVPNVARERRVDVALTNSLGFGGHNCTLILGKV
ncbi:MAG TPA: beta-ketoacyl-ACP synthase II [Chloroflexota bacterium]|nr:beta-ketoacyl-ACP synthase II [Chloroflexota bacterium]